MRPYRRHSFLSISARSATVCATVSCLALLAVLSVPALASVERISLTDQLQPDGTYQADDHSTTSLYGLSSSQDGLVTAFSSFAGNLVVGDNNGASDIFVRDTSVDPPRTELISRTPGGQAGHGSSYHPAITRDGRWVAFASLANDLVPNDTNGIVDVFLHDRQTGSTIRVSEGPAGQQAQTFASFPSIASSEDGTKVFVSFTSSAKNLVAGGTNGLPHIFHFTYDITNPAAPARNMALVSQGFGGVQGDEASVLSAISADGRFVIYTTQIWNIIPPSEKKPLPPVLEILLYDHAVGYTIFRLITTPDDGAFPALSGDGRFLAYVQEGDVVLYDILERKTEIVTNAPDGTAGDGWCEEPSISSDGRFVAFTSSSTNLVPGDTNGVEDVFVRDRATRRTIRVSMTHEAKEANSDSRAPSISEDGQRVVFSSSATNMIAGDSNNREDVFVTNWRTPDVQSGSQPDMLIRRKEATWFIGNDIVNGDGANQTATQAAGWNEFAKYELKIQNDGLATDTFRVTGDPGGNGWLVRYYDALEGGLDITATVNGDGWVTPVLPPGAAVNFRMEVGIDPGVPTNSDWSVLVTVKSDTDVVKLDVVKADTSRPEARSFTKDFGAGVWMAGVPTSPADPSADLVFDTTRVARWDALQQQYGYFTSSPFDIASGVGYWVRYDTPHQLTVAGYAPDPPVKIDVFPDWNLLANPGTAPLTWDLLTFSARHQSFAWVQTDDGTGYDLVSSLDLGNTTKEIGGWQAFWVKCFEVGEATLGTASGTAGTSASDDAVDWALQLCASAGKAQDRANYVGVAKTGEGITGANPPVLGEGYVDLYAVGNAGIRNAVSLASSVGERSWDLIAETDLPDTRVDITFPDLSRVPADLSVTLTDVDAGRTLNMRTSHGYSFVSGAAGARRHLRVEARPRGEGLVITAASARQTGQGVQVVYTLSGAADVRADILNIAGRTVATVPCGYQSSGTHTATWSGAGATGAKVPPGQYLISIQCTGDDGTQTSRVLPTQVR